MNRDLVTMVRKMHSTKSTPASLMLGVDDFLRNFDEMLSRPFNDSNFPPFNIKRRADEYVIEFALAGFFREEIGIHLDYNKNILIVEGESKNPKDNVLASVQMSGVDLEKDFPTLGNLPKVKMLSGIEKSKLENSSTKDLDSINDPNKSEGGFSKADSDLEWSYVHRGIAKRKFKQEFKLPSRNCEVKSAKMNDGMLEITILIPQKKKKETVSVEIK